jgi:hypothetical protein
MTELQKLKEEVIAAKQVMAWHKPNKDAMGTMYYYWEEKKDSALRKIKELKKNNGKAMSRFFYGL